MNEADRRVLLAVTDSLVVKVLETVGKRITRSDRSRFGKLGHQPFYRAHTFWQVDDAEVSKALRGAWGVLPTLMDRHIENCPFEPYELVTMLDHYTRDLVITGTPHSLEELEYRLSKLEEATRG